MVKKTLIKAIIFDLGNVVVFYDHMIASKQMSKLIDIPTKKIYGLLSGNKSRFIKSFSLGANPEVYWGIAAKKLCVKKIPNKKFDVIWNTMFWPNKKLIKTIPKLGKNYKIALISDIGNSHKNYLSKKYGLKKLFKIKIYSCDVKVMKPNKKIFMIALKRLKVKPEEVIFIDDKNRNVKGAKKLGMKGILFKNNKQLFREIKKVGVEV